MKKTIKNNIKLLMYIAMLIMLLLSACTSQSETDNKESVKTEAKKSKKKSSNKKKSSKKKKKNKKEPEKTTVKETAEYTIQEIEEDINVENFQEADEEDIFSITSGYQIGNDPSTRKVISSGRFDPAAIRAGVFWEEDGLLVLVGFKDDYDAASEEARNNFVNAIGGEDSDGYKVCMGGISVLDLPVKELNTHIKTITDAYNEYINSGEDVDFRYEIKKYIEEN
mgnify:FL=1